MKICRVQIIAELLHLVPSGTCVSCKKEKKKKSPNQYSQCITVSWQLDLPGIWLSHFRGHLPSKDRGFRVTNRTSL